MVLLPPFPIVVNGLAASRPVCAEVVGIGLVLEVEGLDAAAGVASIAFFPASASLLSLPFLCCVLLPWTMNVGFRRVREVEAEFLKKSVSLHVVATLVIIGISAS